MPRRAGPTQTETLTRATRSTISSNAAALPVSRRALGDVSNKNASRRSAAKKVSNPPLRRSRRLSRDPAVDGDSTEVNEGEEMRQLSSNNTSLRAEPEASGIYTDAQTSAVVTSVKGTETGNGGVGRSERIVKRSRLEAAEAGPVAKRQKRAYARVQTQATFVDLSMAQTNPCPDILEDGHHGLRREPFDDSKFTSGIAKYDEKYKDELRHVTSYVTDIYQRLYEAETETMPTPYMNKQPELNPLMRSILIDWIVEVHLKFRLVPETLYLAINIIDRYLQRERVHRKRLQLVGVTALLIACKYEEIYPPEVKDCVYITDRAYTRQDVLDMEAHIVKTLKFRMTVPTGYPFLRRFLLICNATRATKCLANFYMERMLQEYSSLSYRPSLVAATAVSLALNNPEALECEGYSPNDGPGVPSSLLEYSGFSIDDIRGVATLLENKVGEVDTTYSRRSLNSVKKKYASDKYDNVSSFILPNVGHLGVSEDQKC